MKSNLGIHGGSTAPRACNTSVQPSVYDVVNGMLRVGAVAVILSIITGMMQFGALAAVIGTAWLYYGFTNLD